MLQFSEVGYEDLAELMSRDAVLFADRMVKQKANTDRVGKDIYAFERDGFPHYADIWVVRSLDKYGGGELAGRCPKISDRYYSSDRWGERRRAGLSLEFMLMGMAQDNALEARSVAVRTNGQISLLTHHNHGSNPRQRVAANSFNTHPSHFVSKSVEGSPKLKSKIYDEWRGDLEAAEQRYIAELEVPTEPYIFPTPKLSQIDF